MGIAEKIASAKKTNWISEGFSENEVKTMVELAKISARIERCRIEMGMNQQEFAKYMGVTQGMVSKWESREYNFTIKTLNEICQKINLKLYVSLEKKCAKSDYTIIRWDSEMVAKKIKKGNWTSSLQNKEAIA
ncbi:MAG: helix-turn-helix domain-containing protein [Eubacterium sp.]